MRDAAVRMACLAALVCAAPGAGGEVRMRLTSSAFEEGGAIPARHTCRGEDISPPLAWDGVPAAAKSLALICDDPDAPMGTWVHWVVFDIPHETRAFREGVPKTDKLEGGARQGMTDFGAVGYGGPCPPSGTHRYFFTLYALDAKLDLAGTVTKERLLAAMKGRVLAEARLVGTFKK